MKEAVRTWNVICGPTLQRVAKLTQERRDKLAQRLADDLDGLPGWEKLCHRVVRSPFLTGDSETEWKATFDWLVEQGNLIKVIEGNYDPPRPNPGPDPANDVPNAVGRYPDGSTVMSRRAWGSAQHNPGDI